MAQSRRKTGVLFCAIDQGAAGRLVWSLRWSLKNVWMMLAKVPSDPVIFEEFENVASRKHQIQHLVAV
jgi:hypothetical protein